MTYDLDHDLTEVLQGDATGDLDQISSGDVTGDRSCRDGESSSESEVVATALPVLLSVSLAAIGGESAAAFALVETTATTLRRVLVEADPEAPALLLNYLHGEIGNLHTRQAYSRAIVAFILWLDAQRLGLRQAEAFHLRQYVELLGTQYKPGTVNQHLAALTGLYQYLRERSSISSNPAQGLKRVKNNKAQRTPYLPSGDTQFLLDRIPTDTVIGLRDRALIGCMVYSFTRISAALDMKVSDYFLQGGSHQVQLFGKGGVHKIIPAHPTLAVYLGSYLDAAGLRGQSDAPLFQSAPNGRLNGKPMRRNWALAMVKRRCRQAEIEARVCNHTFRAVGITAYLDSGGELAKAAHYAGHASMNTTRIYDRRREIGSAEDIARTRL